MSRLAGLDRYVSFELLYGCQTSVAYRFACYFLVTQYFPVRIVPSHTSTTYIVLLSITISVSVAQGSTIVGGKVIIQCPCRVIRIVLCCFTKKCTVGNYLLQ
jgi:hypothetical protein